MKTGFVMAVAAAVALAGAVPAVAGQISTTVSASSSNYSGDLSRLNDGIIPPLGQHYKIDTVHDFGSTVFTFDFGGLVTVNDVLASVDNNDFYTIKFFNGAVQTGTFAISKFDGTVGSGMDSFASFPLGSNGKQLGSSFAYLATKATISASPGDYAYGIGEVQFFNGTSAVPEPASWALMIAGFALIGGAVRQRRGAVGINHI